MRDILTTHDYRMFPEWAERVEVIEPAEVSRQKLFYELVRRAGKYRAVILNGSVGVPYIEPLAALAIRRTRWRAPPIILTDCSWKLGAQWMDRLAMRSAIKILDGPRVRFCVSSSAERELFPKTWGIDKEHVIFTPYANRTTEEERGVPVPPGSGLFAGGNSLRDYGTLLKAVDGLGVPVRIATNVVKDRASLPAGVTVEPIPNHDAFMDAIRGARVVVVPIVPNAIRAAGVDTFLAAMALGKLAIVSDAPGVRDYIEPGRTGLIVPSGQPEALRAAIAWALDPANAAEVAAIAARGSEAAWNDFSFHSYARRLLAIADELIGEG